MLQSEPSQTVAPTPDFASWTNKQLHAELKAHGTPISGKKAVLVARLKSTALAKEVAVGVAPPALRATTTAASSDIVASVTNGDAEQLLVEQEDMCIQRLSDLSHSDEGSIDPATEWQMLVLLN